MEASHGLVIMVPEPFPTGTHVSVLTPFGGPAGPTDGELAEVEKYFAEQAAFDFALTGESRFPGGARYLTPEPALKLSRLTHGLARLFPEYPPYGGAFGLVVPHLRIDDDAVVPPLPVQVHAGEVVLVQTTDDHVAVVATFPLGASAA